MSFFIARYAERGDSHMELFRLLGTIAINNSEANDALGETAGKAEKAESKISGAFKKIGKAGLAVGAAAVAAGTAAVTVADKTAATADKIDKASQKIGISRKAYQELDFICSQCGMSVDNLQGGMKTLTNQMQSASEGGAVATAAFDALGLSIYDSNGELKDQETMMWEAMTALQGMENQTEKAALATDLFGKAGSEMMPLLNGAAGSVEAMKDQAHELGLVINDEAIDAGVAYTDKMDQLKRSFQAASTTAGAALLPIITTVAQWIIDTGLPVFQSLCGSVQDLIKWWGESGLSGTIKTFSSVITPIIKTALGLIKDIITNIVIPAMSKLIQWFGDMAKFAEKHFGFVKDVVSGMMKAVQGVISAISAVIKGDWKGFCKSIVTIIKGIGSSLKAAGKGVLNMLFSGFKSVWTSISKWVSEKVGWITQKFEAVKSFVSSIGTAISGVGDKVGSLLGGGKVAAHAAGGVLTKPTIFGYTPSTGTYHLGGEAGAEAIAPIDVLQGYVRSAVAAENEGQTSIMKAMLEVLQGILYKDTAVYMDGKVIAKAVNKELGGVY